MAEEKKTTKKEKTTTEEVKIEKRFCTKCGKELSEGENCTCESAKTENTSINTDAIISASKGFLDTIINMYKKPATTLKEELNKNNVKNGLIMLAIISVTIGLCITAFFSMLANTANSFSGNFNNFVDVPYFKIFLYMTIIYFVISFIPILATFIVAKLTGNQNFDFKKSINLYATSLAPMVFTNLLMAILYFLNILSGLGAIIGAVVSLACFYHYILGFLDETNIQDDKKSYAITSIIVIWVIGIVIAFVLILGSTYSDLVKESGINQNYNFNTNNTFKW